MTLKTNHSLEVFDTYLKELRSKPLKDITEQSARAPLEHLLKKFSKHNKNISILHEPKRDEGGLGAPDFRIKEGEAILGYVETKKIGENIEILVNSEQIKKYRQLSPNILLTNYVDFLWLRGEHIQQASLGEVNKLFSFSRASRLTEF